MTDKTESEKIRDLLRSFDTAVLITHGPGRELCSRPMLIARVDDNCGLWFLTDRDSAKVHEILVDTHVHVICQKGRTSCVAISGRASLVHDSEKVRELWQPENRVWFPAGEGDPNIVLIHVLAEHGEYWDQSGVQGLITVYQEIKALVTGTAPELEQGEGHGRADLGR